MTEWSSVRTTEPDEFRNLRCKFGIHVIFLVNVNDVEGNGTPPSSAPNRKKNVQDELTDAMDVTITSQ